MKRRNPFDKSFLDANQKIKNNDGIDQIICFLSSPEQSTTSSFDTSSTNLPSMSDTSSTPLSLKLNESPPLVGSLDSVTISTPEITNLVNQVSPISRFVTPPPTADVLDVVLQLSEKCHRTDISEKFDVLVNNNDSEKVFVHPSLTNSSENESTSLDTPMLLQTPLCTIIQSDHGYNSSIPEHRSFSSNDLITSHPTPTRMSNISSPECQRRPASTNPSMADFDIAMKRGRISTQRSLEYGDEPANSTNAYKIITVDGRSMLMLASEYESLVKAVDSGQSSASMTEFEFLSNMDNTPKTINDLITDEDLKKKYLERNELLERNRISASKYRKKKKEEFDILAEKMQTLENEKLQLQAQVSVMKAELERVKKLWNEHVRTHNCSIKQDTPMVQTIIVKDSNGIMRVMEIDRNLLKLSAGQPKSFIQIRTIQNTK